MNPSINDDLNHSLLPTGRLPLGLASFQFNCHPGVSCYLHCCRNVNLLLYPYDILRLKNRIEISSADFLHQYTCICEGSHPYFPGLKLRLCDEEPYPCPFLSETGCSVYVDRPSACRTYPLERGIERSCSNRNLQAHYFLTRHPYCKGHQEARTYTVQEWERDQDLYDFNFYGELWAELDAFFATNPFAGEGKAGPKQQLAFMVCYNIDAFRSYVEAHNLLHQYHLNKTQRRRIQKEDSYLLRFGFQWLRVVLGGSHYLNL